MKRALRWASIALVVLVLGYMGIGLFVASQLTTPARQPLEGTLADEGLNVKGVSLESCDGLDLQGCESLRVAHHEPCY